MFLHVPFSRCYMRQRLSDSPLFYFVAVTLWSRHFQHSETVFFALICIQASSREISETLLTILYQQCKDNHIEELK